LEVRQALEIVKERVEEIKKDKEWKEKIAEKYNDEDVKSNASKRSRKEVEKGENDRKKEEWDSSVRIMKSKAEKIGANEEEKIAKLVADQVLANYPVKIM
jgi:hypothetical protein